MKLETLTAPKTVTECICSVCRRYGVLWAYYSQKQERILAREGATNFYLWGDRSLEFHRCQRCGCVTYWEAVKQPAERMGINARLMAPEVRAAARRRRLDGADTWKYLDE